MAALEEIRTERIKKLNYLKEVKHDPYPAQTKLSGSLSLAIKNFEKFSKAKKSLTLAGRIMGKRGQGAISFVDLMDGTGKLQVLFHREKLKSELWELFLETADVGDFVEVRGELFLTKREEKTLEVKNWRMLTKSLRQLPDKWHGLKDVEERFRRRYLDSLMDEKIRERFILRSKIISSMREQLSDLDYLEVETPILQSLPGGASALPFKTHYNSLDQDFFLRVAPELYLKKMLVGGFDRVFEFARNFRNEGVDVTHMPEFTMLEYYEAYSDASKQMEQTEKMFKKILKDLSFGQTIMYGEHEIDFKPKFEVITYFDLIKKFTLISEPDKMDLKELALRATQFGATLGGGESRSGLLDQIYKRACRPKVIQPTFIIDYPKEYLPLAKAKIDQPEFVEAFQLVIGGLELVKAFSELNDPLDQRERFVAQEKQKALGDTEAQPNDEEFLEALEYGMPPAGGVGIGIDRLVMLLTNTQNIREVIYFPTLRTK